MLRVARSACNSHTSSPIIHIRAFSQVSKSLEKALPPRPKILDSEITESFLKGSGPGGQKINKTSSAVQIKHLPTGIVVKSQDSRSREYNRKVARQLLAEKLDQIEKGDQSRTAIKAERARNKKASKEKKARRKYRALAGEKGRKAGEDGTLEDEGNESGGDNDDGMNEISGHSEEPEPMNRDEQPKT
jgi:peptide chain release factor